MLLHCPTKNIQRRIIMKRLAALFLAVTCVLGLNISAGAASGSDKIKTAVMQSSDAELKAEGLKTLAYKTYGRVNWNWNSVSPISDFFHNGKYTIAYSDDDNLYISHIGDDLQPEDCITIKKKYPLIGGVTVDESGNFYAAYGQEDTDSKGGIVVFSVVKYTAAGVFVDSCDYMSTGDYWDTRVPFDAGNCAMAWNGDYLIVSYAREMYSGHQSNDVFCVDTTTMTEIDLYDSYVSHSFNQAVIILDDGTAVIADHGDAHSRGIVMNFVPENGGYMNGHYSQGYCVFHYDGETGDNYTNAKLTGVTALDTGVAVVGTAGDYSTKSSQNLYMQVIDPDTCESVLNGSSRTAGGYTDTGIKWLTDYTDDTVGSVAMAGISDNKLLVMWERYDENEDFVNSYYILVDSNGNALTEPISLHKAHVNGAEELKYNGGYAYWTYGDGNTVQIYKLNVNETSTDTIGDAEITLSQDSYVYNGKAKKPSVTVTYEGEKLAKGTDYTVKYSNNKSMGVAAVTVTGIGKYGGKAAAEFTITPSGVKKLTATTPSKTKTKLTWKKLKGASGYQVEITKYAKESGSYWYRSTDSVYRTTKKTTFTHTRGKGDNIFHYRVRPYITVNGEKIYGEWSEEMTVYPR